MIGYEQHKKNKEIPTIKTITCPACNKDRLSRYVNADGSVSSASEEVIEVRGESRHLDVCGMCVSRYRQQDQRFVLDNYRKMVQAMSEVKTDEVDGKQTDHKDFSLN